MYVGVSDFVFDVPDPMEIDGQVKTFVEKSGFSGDNLFIAGHGLGGVISQQYAESSKDLAKQIKGSILTGSVLLRDYHNLTMDGETYFTINKPTYTLLGNLDGQMRITRGAEQYYHQIMNIIETQKG
jgi:alpha-beta hydrolase superfamily lysophospholipase